MLVTQAAAQPAYVPTAPYAVTRQLDPGRGELQMTGSTWTRGQPMVEIAVRILRTPRGTYQLDQTFGVDMSTVKTVTSGTGAAFQAAIYQAFDFYIKRGFVTKFKAFVSVSATGAVTYDVSFVDPRAQLLIGITGP